MKVAPQSFVSNYQKVNVIESTRQLEYFVAIRFVAGVPSQWRKVDVIFYETKPSNLGEALEQVASARRQAIK